jgi:hypothetical protein
LFFPVRCSLFHVHLFFPTSDTPYRQQFELADVVIGLDPLVSQQLSPGRSLCSSAGPLSKHVVEPSWSTMDLLLQSNSNSNTKDQPAPQPHTGLLLLPAKSRKLPLLAEEQQQQQQSKGENDKEKHQPSSPAALTTTSQEGSHSSTGCWVSCEGELAGWQRCVQPLLRTKVVPRKDDTGGGVSSATGGGDGGPSDNASFGLVEVHVATVAWLLPPDAKADPGAMADIASSLVRAAMDGLLLPLQDQVMATPSSSFNAVLPPPVPPSPAEAGAVGATHVLKPPEASAALPATATATAAATTSIANTADQEDGKDDLSVPAACVVAVLRSIRGGAWLASASAGALPEEEEEGKKGGDGGGSPFLPARRRHLGSSRQLLATCHPRPYSHRGASRVELGLRWRCHNGDAGGSSIDDENLALQRILAGVEAQLKISLANGGGN